MHLYVVCNNNAMGGGRGNGHFTVTCKVSGDNLMGAPTNLGYNCLNLGDDAQLSI